MPPIMNRIGRPQKKNEEMCTVKKFQNMKGVHVSMFGNHDFDFGEEEAIKLTAKVLNPFWLAVQPLNLL